MSDAAISGSEFKKQLRAGSPKMGLFLNAHSPTVAEQLAHSGYDWLLVDTQHGPMGYEKLSAMLSGIANGGAKSLVRVGGYDDRPGIVAIYGQEFGEANINIAGMQIARTGAGGKALSVLTVDSRVPEGLLETVRVKIDADLMHEIDITA